MYQFIGNYCRGFGLVVEQWNIYDTTYELLYDGVCERHDFGDIIQL